VIVTGWFQSSPRVFNWTPEYLVGKAGDVTVPVRRVDSLHSQEWLGSTQHMPFREFMRIWARESQTSTPHAPPSYYLASLPIQRHLPALAADVVPPPHAAQQNKSGNLWVGCPYQETPLHYDWSSGDQGMDGLHAIVSGEKVFYLIDPADSGLLVPRKRTWGHLHQAQERWDSFMSPWSTHQHAGRCASQPQHHASPHAPMGGGGGAGAVPTYYEVTLAAGEMLFVPKLWWHKVVTTQPTIALNFWFQHVGSEWLKVYRHWQHMEQYLEAVESMQASDSKYRGVLQFYGACDAAPYNALASLIDPTCSEEWEEEEEASSGAGRWSLDEVGEAPMVQEGRMGTYAWEATDSRRRIGQLQGRPVCQKGLCCETLRWVQLTKLELTQQQQNREKQYPRRKVTDAVVAWYRSDPHRLMLLPKFVDGFGSIADYPLFAHSDANELAACLRSMVETWVLRACQRRCITSAPLLSASLSRALADGPGF